MNPSLFRFTVAVVCSGVIPLVLTISAARAEQPPELLTAKLSKDAVVAVTASQASRALMEFERSVDWNPQANDELSRGPAAVVYPKVAPATVVVRAGGGHGTGFVIDREGWILTNHHVVEVGSVDADTGALTVSIYRGRLNRDGVMQLDEKAIPATVYKVSEEKDLALLRLNKLPAGNDALAVVQLADKPAAPGASCVAIGHPRAGLLWTVRSGEVSGVGVWPGEMIEAVMTRLSMSGRQQDHFAKLLRSAPQRKVLVSSCGINPGDSGGPLLNEEGQLIAVTFAIPRGGAEEGISLDKFSYHVHLDEVKRFIADRPDRPELFVPDPWPAAMFSQLMDSDNDERPDLSMFGMHPEQPPTGLLYDLDQDTPKAFQQEYEIDPTAAEKWDFEFAVQQYPLARTFYDTDNDGHTDLILADVDNDYLADLTLTRRGTRWVKDDAAPRPMFDPTAFDDPALQERFIKVLRSEPQPIALINVEAEVAAADTPEPETGSATGSMSTYFVVVVACLVAGIAAGYWLRRPKHKL